MERHCIRHTELPGASRLFSDLLYQFDRVERFYAHAPYDPDSYERAARQVMYPADRREAVVAALREQNPGNPSVDKLAGPKVVAVVTGQQVGLFGGPLYAIFKALAAAKLAKQLSERGICAVPVFWMATEDHDLDEINKAWVYDAGQRPVALGSTSVNPGHGPVGPIALRGIPLDGLRQALAGLPFAEEALALAEAAYRDGETFGSAFRKLMEPLLRPYGMIFLDPLAPSIRAIAAPFLSRALAMSRELVEAVEARGRELDAAGYHAQVHLDNTATLLFSLEGGKRTALKRAGETIPGTPERAEMLSPNALLRPVMQDYLLPTVAYLGGPAELAYFAQSAPIYEKLLGRMPVVAHRASFTLLDRRAGKLMGRYGLELPELAVPEVDLRERMARRLVPDGLQAQFAGAQAAVGTEIDRLAAAMRGFDPGLEKALGKSRAKILYQIGKMEKKTAREAMRRDERAGADAGYLHNLVYPHRHLQERMYGVLPFVATHGPEVVARVWDAIEPGCTDHRVLSFE